MATGIEIPTEVWSSLWTLVIVIAAAAAAWFRKIAKDLGDAVVTAKAEAAEMNEIADQAIEEKEKIVSYFDPTDLTVNTAPEGLNPRTYLMNDETKRFALMGEVEPQRTEILEQISAAEAKKLDTYTIRTTKGRTLIIEYGLIKGGSSGDMK